jgi:hypothetical protein
MTRGRLDPVPQRSWNPVRWLTSRDRTALNYFGLAILGTGAATAVATWLARFTSKAVPWWPVIVGLAALALGLALALATVGARPETMVDSSILDGGEAGLDEEADLSRQVSAAPHGGSQVEEPSQLSPKVFQSHFHGPVHGFLQGDHNQATIEVRNRDRSD